MQAVAVTAYHKFDQLEKLVSILSERFEVFVHIDRKAAGSFAPPGPRVHCYSEYRVNWGGCNHLRAILFLMREALKDPAVDRVHLISGEDWPVRNPAEIEARYEGRNDIDILCTRFSKMTEEWYGVCRDWQQLYHWYDVLDYKKISNKVILKLLLAAQKLLRVDRYRKVPGILGDGELAQGLVWGSYPRDAIEYCLRWNREHPELLKFLADGQAPEEYFFHTILSNSPEFEPRITNRHLRYMNWTVKNGSYPGILDMDDFQPIETGDWCFCRKVDLGISKELLAALHEAHGV